MIAWLSAAILTGVALVLWRVNARIGGNLPKAGDSAPGFALADQNGQPRTLDEFRGNVDPRGKVAKVYVGVNAGRNAQNVSDDLKLTAKE